jgi:hypothetical protein
MANKFAKSRAIRRIIIPIVRGFMARNIVDVIAQMVEVRISVSML